MINTRKALEIHGRRSDGLYLKSPLFRYEVNTKTMSAESDISIVKK